MPTPHIFFNIVSTVIVYASYIFLVPQGNEVLTGSWVASNALQLWDLGSGELIQTLPCVSSNQYPGLGGEDGMAGEFLYCARFAPNNVVLAGGSGTNSVYAIDCHNLQVREEVALPSGTMHSFLHMSSRIFYIPDSVLNSYYIYIYISGV